MDPEGSPFTPDDEARLDADVATSSVPLLALNTPSSRRRTRRRSRFSPMRCCLYSCGLVTILIAFVVARFVLSVLRSVWTDLTRPHVAIFHNESEPTLPRNESNLIPPFIDSFFGPKGYTKFDLGVTLMAWEKPSTAMLNDTDENSAPNMDLLNETILQTILLRDIEISSKPIQSVLHVTLPAAVVLQLINNDRAQLTANFVMLPIEGTVLPSSEQVDTVRAFQKKEQNPSGLPTEWTNRLVPDGNNLSRTQLDNFFSASSTTHSLIIRPASGNITSQLEAGPISFNFTTSKPPPETPYASEIISRSWVTMARDYPTYNATRFLRAMKKAGDRIAACERNCRRTYHREGHYESLMYTMKSDGELKGWYGPFITTKMGAVGPFDLLRLAPSGNESKVEAEDFSYNWTITWSTSSSAKLSFLNIATPEGHSENATEYQKAVQHDYQEFLNGVLGHGSESRQALVRGVVSWVGLVSRLGSFLFLVHYWYTRSSSTGISLPMIVISSALEAPFAIWQTTWLWDHPIALFASAIDSTLLVWLLFLQTMLYLRLEIIWGRRWLSIVPVGLDRRPATHSERTSARADARFPYRLKAALVVVVFLCARFIPTYDLLHGSRPPLSPESDVLAPQAVGRVGSILRSLQDPLSRAFFVTSSVSQITLNHRLRSFASGHPVQVFLGLASVLLFDQSILLSRWLGKGRSLSPVTVSDAVIMFLLAVTSWQAATLPTVKQEEEEVE